jgi:hypothetical protein
VKTLFYIVVIIFLAFPHAVAAEVNRQLTPEQEEFLSATQTLTDDTMQALDAFWLPWFTEHNLNTPLVTYVTLRPENSITSNCLDAYTLEQVTVTGVTNNAMYCSADWWEVNGVLQQGLLIIPLWPLGEMLYGDLWDIGTIPPGSYAPVAMLAHEYSHHIVDEISMQKGVAQPVNPYSELLPDCLAGSFMGYVNQYVPLSDEQVAAVVLGWGLIGDPSADIRSHGTAENRQSALQIGYNGGYGTITQCFNLYWPEIVPTL